jgi:RecA/RadA recombinase
MFNSLTDAQILIELLAHNTQKHIAEQTNISNKTLSNLINSEDDYFKTKETSILLREYFKKHTINNSKNITIGDLVNSAPSINYLVNSPDGYVGIGQFFIKKPRKILTIKTQSYSISCSNDHLIETDFGWAKTENLKIGLNILTKSGFEFITEIIDTNRVEEVYDFEALHENHRYWGGSGISSHNSGKSLLTCGIIKNAQEAGAIALVLDSENALSEDFVQALGVDTSPEKYIYVGVTTIQDVTVVLSEFITGYEKEYGRDNFAAPKILLVLDSLDMLLTDGEAEKFEKGIQTGDMGGRTKMFKHLLRTIVAKITRLPMTFLCTHQTYLNQDMLNGLGEQIVNNAVRYSASQIALLKGLKLKDGQDIKGIRVKAECYKSRFAQPGIKAELEVPYETGLDQFSGVIDMLVEMGVVTQGGAWYSFEVPGKDPIKFQRKNLTPELFEQFLKHTKIQEEESLFAKADVLEPIEE